MKNIKFICICIYEKFPNQFSQKLVINWVKHHGVTSPCKNKNTPQNLHTP